MSEAERLKKKVEDLESIYKLLSEVEDGLKRMVDSVEEFEVSVCGKLREVFDYYVRVNYTYTGVWALTDRALRKCEELTYAFDDIGEIVMLLKNIVEKDKHALEVKVRGG